MKSKSAPAKNLFTDITNRQRDISVHDCDTTNHSDFSHKQDSGPGRSAENSSLRSPSLDSSNDDTAQLIIKNQDSTNTLKMMIQALGDPSDEKM